MLHDHLKPLLIKAASYCAYQERCEKEVRQKMADWPITPIETDDVIAELIAQKYLDNGRFAKSFVRGKFRYKHWGRIKIRQELRIRGISNELIMTAFREIDDDEYCETLENLLTKKNKELKADSQSLKQHKLLRFGLSRGFESDLIWDVLKRFSS